MPSDKDTQQAGLQIGRHVADFVEKERAAFGLLEAPAALRLRAGKRAALVAEQLGFKQIFRNGRGVDGDERLAGTRAVAMQGARHQLLAEPDSPVIITVATIG
jgi:hypothetical protein